jgi:stearoyl-CoA desaturase (delta-9 desaturase)
LAQVTTQAPATTRTIDWAGLIPYSMIHLLCFGVFFVGISPIAVAVAAGLYFFRMFAVTAFYHRYFSHRTFKTSRGFQFAAAVMGNSCVQRGPIWWAAHHRHHHRYSDHEGDIHSPHQDGFFWSHMGWITTRENAQTNWKMVRDLAQYPELRWIDKHHGIVPLLLAAGLFGLGALLERVAPGLHTNGWQMFIWGFCVSTTVLYHAVYTINSLAHKIGGRRYQTRDDSRNNFFLALLTFGEGWHNNHHFYPGSTRQGFYWWEVDITYYLLVALSWTGLVWDLRSPPTHVRDNPAAVTAASPSD